MSKTDDDIGDGDDEQYVLAITGLLTTSAGGMTH